MPKAHKYSRNTIEILCIDKLPQAHLLSGRLNGWMELASTRGRLVFVENFSWFRFCVLPQIVAGKLSNKDDFGISVVKD